MQKRVAGTPVQTNSTDITLLFISVRYFPLKYVVNSSDYHNEYRYQRIKCFVIIKGGIFTLITKEMLDNIDVESNV